jgi:RNA polymerase sigma factor (sigma-70 family)
MNCAALSIPVTAMRPAALDKAEGTGIMRITMIPFLHKDRMLIGRILEGNIQSWQRFILDFSVFIYSTVVRFTTDYDEKMAIYLQILEQLRANDFEKLRRFAFRSSLSTWLTAVSRNMTIDFLRSKYGRDFRWKKIRVISLSDDCVEPADPSLERQPEAAHQSRERESIRNQLLAELEMALEGLDEREALLVKLVFFKGLKIRDAGQVLKIKPAYKFLHRTLRKIRIRLTATSSVSPEKWSVFFRGDAHE